MAKQISANVNILLGLNNALDPSSPLYPEGAACVSDNSRIDKEGVWNKGPTTASCSSPPTATTVPGKSGNHFADIHVNGTHYIADGLGDTDTIAEGNNGLGYYLASGVPKWWDGTDSTTAVENTNYGTAGLTPPTSPSAAVSTSKGSRQEEGLYYYMFTAYNTTRKVESLPSSVVEHWVHRYYVLDVRQADVPKVKATSSGNTIRVYRSLKIDVKKGDSMQRGQVNSPTKFYFVGEVASGSYFYDYAHDREIQGDTNLYTGRGAKPPQTGVDAIASFQNRMFYFVDDVAYFSSAGRDEEVPQSYTLTIGQTYSRGNWSGDELSPAANSNLSLTQKPVLDNGLCAEAKIKIKELLGQTVVRAKEIGGKFWIWTADMTGYLVATAKYEGFRFVKVADGIGLCSPWTLSVGRGGVFGADKKGIWKLEGEYPKRLSYGIIDIADSGKSTYCASGNLAASFGVWVDELNEYWWSVNNVQLVYQADRGVFVGPYNLTLSGGCGFVSAGGTQCYLTGAKTPVISSRTGIQALKFWLGQKTSPDVKDNLQVNIIYNGITASQTITASVYQNNIASETGASASNSQSHTDSDLVGRIPTNASGRFFEVALSIPSACIAPVAAINYSAQIVPMGEKALR